MFAGLVALPLVEYLVCPIALSPSSVVVSKDGRVKIQNFGVGDSPVRSQYAAPEQLRGSKIEERTIVSLRVGRR